MVKNYFVLIMLAFIGVQAQALETLIDRPPGNQKGLVVIAPAKKYLMRERLFSKLSENLANNGYLVLRLNWSSDTLQDPTQEIPRASRDIQTALLSAQKDFGFHPEQTVLISKSFSTKAIDASLGLAKTHILLTPNCSVEAPFQKTYANVLSRDDIFLRMLISNEDPNCQVEQIRQTLTALSKESLLTTTHGDHNFVLVDPVSSEPSYNYQDFVIKQVVDQVELSFREGK